MSQDLHQFLCIHGHFYQPPREDPFTGRIAPEHGAAPFADFNEKIAAECYRPNAEMGNFEHISFDLGPTLALWLERSHPDIYAAIIRADQNNLKRYGSGNALAQAYNHTILPLAGARDKRTQILWGLQDFAHRFGHPAEGMWLAETAVDMETLTILAEAGVRYTVLAPWQAAEAIDPTEPYRVALPGGRHIIVFFYNAPLSGGISFEGDVTINADTFAASFLPKQLNHEKVNHGTDQLIVVATDGELYGHHKTWRDRFLEHLVQQSARAAGFQITTLGRYLATHQPQREVGLHVPSSWSCAHGVARWDKGCECTDGDASWKPQLRLALDHLSARLDEVFERETAQVLYDPWAARDGYLGLHNGWQSRRDFWSRYGRNKGRLANKSARRRAESLLAAQYFGQCMYTSCGFFFEDLDRIEPRNDIAFARRAISLVWQATGIDLETDFLADLAIPRSSRTGRTGADLYRLLPPVGKELLPVRRSRSAGQVA
jgi:alpha-amylase/alpha-mannosidase (GH57 family)